MNRVLIFAGSKRLSDSSAIRNWRSNSTLSARSLLAWVASSADRLAPSIVWVQSLNISWSAWFTLAPAWNKSMELIPIDSTRTVLHLPLAARDDPSQTERSPVSAISWHFPRFRHFAVQRLLWSECTQKVVCRELKELSNGYQDDEIRLKFT